MQFHQAHNYTDRRALYKHSFIFPGDGCTRRANPSYSFAGAELHHTLWAPHRKAVLVFSLICARLQPLTLTTLRQFAVRCVSGLHTHRNESNLQIALGFHTQSKRKPHSEVARVNSNRLPLAVTD